MKLSQLTRELKSSGIENARGEAYTLFSHFGHMRREDMIGTDPEIDDALIADALSRRLKREPLQHIIGSVDFYREHYRVSPDCLIPREDTEILVDLAVKNIPEGARFVDLCTGSGCVAISTLNNTKSTTAVAVDISEGALAMARINAEENGVCDRLELLCQDALCDAVDGEIFAVLSNPPYIREEVYPTLEPELFFEPRIALVGFGEEGAGFYDRITALYRDKIAKDGFLAYEIGYDQADILIRIAEKYSMTAEIIKDFSHNPRVAVLRRK